MAVLFLFLRMAGQIGCRLPVISRRLLIRLVTVAVAIRSECRD